MNWFKENSDRFEGLLKFEEGLSKHTYFKIGGSAQIFVSPKSLDDLKWIAQGLQETGLPFFILGAGSNVLVSDQGFRGVVIKVRTLNSELFPIRVDGQAAFRLRTGASVPIPSLLHRVVENGWGGLEFLTGIPGTVGGATIMNAGTHLGETMDALRAIEVFPLSRRGTDPDSDFIRYEGKSLKYSYRKNHFIQDEMVVWAAEWEVNPKDPSAIKKTIEETLKRRKDSQPVDLPCCGSVFKNPKSFGLSAWQVIDRLGLRGYRIGDAQFSEKHANFILNLGQARAQDVRELIEMAKARALKELQIELEEEVRYVGF